MLVAKKWDYSDRRQQKPGRPKTPDDVVQLVLQIARENPHIERFMKSLKTEALENMIFFGEAMLRNAVREYLVHYHEERNHQGLANKIIQPKDGVGGGDGEIECRERLGGLLRSYHCKAA